MSRKWRDDSHSRLQANPASAIPRPFLPPSYYAAAGGIPYPRNLPNQPSDNTTTSATSAGVERQDRPGTRARGSELPSSALDSSFHSRLKVPQARMRGDHRKSGIPTGQDPSSTTGGKWQGLSPDVEADLIPSLQSTIHRMTRPPSGILADSTNLGGHGYQYQYESGGSVGRPTAAVTSAKTGDSSSDARAHNQGQGVAPRSRIPQKSALMSALRPPLQKAEPTITETTIAPTPPPASLLVPTPAPPAPRSPSRNSLRSVKSLLSRKLGGAQQSAPPSPAISSTQPKPERSTAYANNILPSSHLPRLKTKHDYNSQWSAPAHTSQVTDATTDESDLENKYERQWMERRRLTVANAEVVPSGSSSSESSSSLHDNLPTPRPGQYLSYKPPHLQHQPNNPSNRNLRPGLGFDLHHQKRANYSSVTAPNSPLLPNIEYPDRDKTKILRFSLPPSGSDASLYSNHQLSYPGSWDTENENEDVYSEPGEYRVSVQSATSTASSNPGRRVPIPREDIIRGYGRNGVSGSDSEGFESDREHHQRLQGRFTVHNGHGGWDQSLTQPRPGRYPHASSHRVVPKATLQRSDQRDARKRLSASPVARPEFARPNPADLGLRSPSTPKLTSQINSSHTWFNESSGSFESDEFDHIPITPQRKAPPPPRFEATSLSQEWRRQAAQQREAFGLPPSVSDEGNMSGSGASRWSQSDSYRSSVASTRWEWNGEEGGSGDGEDELLSSSAENMIKGLHPEWDRSTPATTSSQNEASFYEDQSDSFETAGESTPLNTSSESGRAAHEHYAPATARQTRQAFRNPRDEIILEFLRSEETFLSNTQLCIDNFILPLRTENSRSWIGGVPTNVSRLLDWFEDIANLHLAVYQSLESSAAVQEADIGSAGLAGYLYDFVGKLHVYQPYLVSLADVLEEVSMLVGDGRSDFGEFIRIQEKEVESVGWTFESLLMEPVNRLAVYQDLFSGLLEATPQGHPEFLATVLLSRSADTVMRVMTEVKVRETERRLIQSLAAQMDDPAISNLLCSRERRLLHSGTLRLVSPAINLDPAASQPSMHQVKAQKRSSRLVQAITNWDRKPERSNSLKSITSSVKSFSTISSFSSGPPATSALDSSRSSKLPLLKGLFKGKEAPPLPPMGLPSDTPNVPADCVQAFVFSDLLLLVLPRPTAYSKYSVVPKAGLSKVFSVSSEEAGSLGAGEGFRVQVIPTAASSVEADTLPKGAAIITLVLEASQLGPEVPGAPGEQMEDCCIIWTRAFEKSAEDTAQLLSCPGPRRAVPSERSKNTWLAVSSLIASGLPLPRSASGQLPDLRYGKVEEEVKKLEREERGWWSLKYQQVLGEYVHPSH